jgi:hypothetical protein
VQQQGNGYDCGLYCYAFSKRALQRHADLKACNGQNDDLLKKIHGILVEGYEDSIKPLQLRKEMYGHMQDACRLDEMEAREASKDVQTKRLWRYNPNVLNVMSSKEKEESSTHEVQQVAGRVSLSQPKRVSDNNEQQIVFAEASLITAFQFYIADSIKAKNSLSKLVKMLLEDAQYYNHILERGFTLINFLNGFGKVCLLLMFFSYNLMLMVCYVMLFSDASVQEDN